jgi:hypothetical protein
MGEEMDSRSQLIKYALIAIGGIVGGIIILFLKNLGPVSGIIVGAIIGIIGLAMVLSKKDNSFVGVIVLFAGACLILSKIPILGWLAVVLLNISGWILIIAGIVAAVFFIKSIASRV